MAGYCTVKRQGGNWIVQHDCSGKICPVSDTSAGTLVARLTTALQPGDAVQLTDIVVLDCDAQPGGSVVNRTHFSWLVRSQQVLQSFRVTLNGQQPTAAMSHAVAIDPARVPPGILAVS
jgi:hypothetical protein